MLALASDQSKCSRPSSDCVRSQDGEGAVQNPYFTPDINGHVMPVAPDADGSAACNGVRLEQISQGSNNMSETPAGSPEVSLDIRKVGLNCINVHAWALNVPLG